MVDLIAYLFYEVDFDRLRPEGSPDDAPLLDGHLPTLGDLTRLILVLTLRRCSSGLESSVAEFE